MKEKKGLNFCDLGEKDDLEMVVVVWSVKEKKYNSVWFVTYHVHFFYPTTNLIGAPVRDLIEPSP